MLPLARISLAVALAVPAMAVPAPGAQGPDQGSPFVDAPLPFEQLKAPPDSSFEILVASLGVFLLVPITAAAFMALARLRNLEDSLRADLKQVREALGGVGGVGAGGASAADQVAQSVADLTRALESSERPGAAAETDRIITALEAMQAEQAAASKAVADRLQEALAALAASAASGAGPGAGSLGPLDAARGYLEGLGYSHVEIVTPPEDITPALLADGALVVEARRDGATHKGKVLFKGGAPTDVQLQGGHGVFP